MIESFVGVKIIIGKLDILIVKLCVFWQNIVDRCPAITYEFFICDEFLDDGDDVLNFGVFDDSGTFPFFN